MGAASRRAPAWRLSCLALCLLPVALPLLLLCLPLLCVAVAVVRFRRRRRRLLLMTTVAGKSRSCCPGERSPHGDEGHRAALLHKYLEDQMELVGADAGPGDAAAPAAAVAVDPRPSSQRSSSSVRAERRSCSADWAQETELGGDYGYGRLI